MERANVMGLLEESQRDLEFYGSHLKDLRQKFNDQFVAISSQKIIDSDQSLDVLLERLRSKSIDPSNTLIKFVSKIKAVL